MHYEIIRYATLKPEVVAQENYIIKGLEDPNVVKIFEDVQAKSILSNNEDIHIMCLRREDASQKLKLHIFNDLDEHSKSESNASSRVDVNVLNTDCPQKDYHRIIFHTHTHSISGQSRQDRLTAQRLKEIDLSETMCALGIDGVECHLTIHDPPSIIRSSWNQPTRLMTNANIIKINSLSEEQKIKKNNVSQFDQILCTQEVFENITHYNCRARNWGNGADDFYLGKFNAMSFNEGSFDISGGDVDSTFFGGVIGTSKQNRPWECFAIPFIVESSNGKKEGKKLICI